MPKTTISRLRIGLLVCICALFPAVELLIFGLSTPATANGRENNAPLQASRTTRPPTSQCDAAGKLEITIRCEYLPTPRANSEELKAGRLVLNTVLISFEPKDESYMHVELTFTNEGAMPISHAFGAYLVIDDDRGHNQVRRVLPRVDLGKIAPGQRSMFSERILVSAFSPGHYTIYLWISNSNASAKSAIAADSLLLSNVGIAERRTGLNTLATFTVLQ